jgi:putative ABC transport system permease protein
MILQLLAVSATIVIFLLALDKVPLRYNLRNLTLRYRATAAIVLAFILVISLLVVMLAFVNGVRRLALGSGQPGNVLVLAYGATDEVYSKLNVVDLAEVEHLPAIEHGADGKILASRETYLVVNQPIAKPTPGLPKYRFLQLRGVDDPLLSAQVHKLRLQPGGKWFSSAGVEELPAEPRTLAIQTLLGEGAARELAHYRTPEQLATARRLQQLDVGDVFALSDRTCIVVGIIGSTSSTFGSEIWAKRSVIGPLFGKDAVTSVVLRTRDDATARQLKDFLNSEYKTACVAAQVETDYYASLADTNQQFLTAVIVVTLVMASGGVVGVMDTMFAATSQRVKDIGVLRVLGYSRWQILVCFLLESLVIATVGGLVGCALGMLANGWTATSTVAAHYGGGKEVVFRLVVEPQTLAVGFLLALIMGFLGGLLPAWSAMSLRPLKSLVLR